MTTSLKKLLLISITLLLGVMSAGVRAQTNYNFTESFIGHGGLSDVTLSGVFQTNTGPGEQSILGWSNLTFGPNTNPLLNSSATYFPTSTAGALPLGSYDAKANVFGDGPDYYGSNVVFNSILSNPGKNHSWVFLGTSLPDGGGLSYCQEQDCANGTGMGFYSNQGYTITQGAAPEIDGSLAPKVGFLLGCLFLMFGRKKQDSKPMMTA